MFKVGDRVKWRYTHYGNRTSKGCVVINAIECSNRYKVMDYDNQNVSGNNVETWVNEHHIELDISEQRNKKLNELGI